MAAFASWHEGHAAVTAALTPEVRLPAQVLIESYSVLTRLPPPHRAPSELVATFLKVRFPQPPLLLSDQGHRDLLRELTRNDLRGGAVYDAVVASTARQADALLLTRDRRAVKIYERIGARCELLF